MQPIIKKIEQRKLVGVFTNMSLVENRTFELFSTFMPKRKLIRNCIDEFIYDLIIYPSDYFQNFNPTNSFKKGALVEVVDHTKIPDGMTAFTLVGGEYAVFSQKGKKYDASMVENIFTKWLPASKYSIDNRPHFDILKENSKGKEEEIWIPIKLK